MNFKMDSLHKIVEEIISALESDLTVGIPVLQRHLSDFLKIAGDQYSDEVHILEQIILWTRHGRYNLSKIKPAKKSLMMYRKIQKTFL